MSDDQLREAAARALGGTVHVSGGETHVTYPAEMQYEGDKIFMLSDLPPLDGNTAFALLELCYSGTVDAAYIEINPSGIIAWRPELDESDEKDWTRYSAAEITPRTVIEACVRALQKV